MRNNSYIFEKTYGELPYVGETAQGNIVIWGRVKILLRVNVVTLVWTDTWLIFSARFVCGQSYVILEWIKSDISEAKLYFNVISMLIFYLLLGDSI